MHQVIDQTHLRWTKDRPISPGTYWVRANGRFITMAKVTRSHPVRSECAATEPWDGLCFRLWEVPPWHKNEILKRSGYASWVHYGGSNYCDSFEWAGPIPQPEN